MHGYETVQQRKEHLKALAVELDGVKRAIPVVQQQVEDVPEGSTIERVTRERDLANLKERARLIEEQIRTFKGEAPHKRATTRKQDATEKR